MKAGATSSSNIGHPAPGRSTVGKLHLATALFGAPAAWIAQMSLSEILSGYGCYPHRRPIDAPLWNHLSLMLAAISVACLVCGVSGTIIAWLAWQRSKKEYTGEEHHVIDIGEGRLRFLTMIGALTSMIFLIAIAFTACANILVSPCGA